MCRFFGFKSCTMVTFMILLKLHVWEKSDSQVNAKMLSANQIAGFLNFNVSKTVGGIKLIFLHTGTYQLKLQIYPAILGGHGQAYPGMPKEAIRT